MTTRLYYTDHSCRGAACVTALGGNGRAYVVLDATLFHPQGGGQQADQGVLGDRAVRHVGKDDTGEILHFVDSIDGLSVGDSIDLAIDPAIRRRNAGLHTAGHLIAGLVEQLYTGVRATGGHHWPGEARVDFSGAAGLNKEQLSVALAAALDASIAHALPIIQSSDVPPPRTVSIEGFPALPCGGTHVMHLGELGSVVLRRVRVNGDALRVSYDVLASEPSEILRS